MVVERWNLFVDSGGFGCNHWERWGILDTQGLDLGENEDFTKFVATFPNDCKSC